MSDRPTPETDAACREFFIQYGTHANCKGSFARRLERERDALREVMERIASYPQMTVTSARNCAREALNKTKPKTHV